MNLAPRTSGSFTLLRLAQMSALLFAMIGLFSPLFAQAGNGAVTGTVRNASTGALLSGAEATLAGTGLTATSQRDGSFLFPAVPAGNYTLRVGYTGLDARETSLAVAGGETVHVPVDLTSSIYQLEKFTVISEREGSAAAITEQRNAANLVNVVALDAYGNVADNNMGNFLKRLPGVAGVGEGGDITGLSVRGAPRGWNAINIDGARASAAYSGTDANLGRSVVTDQLPSENVKEVKVIKTLTPDLSSDSVGGTIDLVTKSGLDVANRQLSLRLGGTYNTYRPEVQRFKPAGAFTYLSRLNGGTMGVALSGSYDEVNNARDRVQMTTALNGLNTQARTLNDNYVRLRTGGAVKFNYRPADKIELWTGFQYSYFSTQQVRQDWNIQAANSAVADYNVVSRAQIEAGTAPRTTANAAAGVAPGFNGSYTEFLNANFTNTQGGLTRHARNYKVEAGADFALPADQKITIKGSASPSDYRFIFQRLAAVRTGGFGLAIDGRDDRSLPRYTQTYGTTIAAGADLNLYKASLTSQDQYSKETILNGNADYVKKAVLREAKIEYKGGLNWRRQKRTLSTYQPVWNYVGADGVQGTTAAGANDDNLRQFVQAEPGYGVFKNLYPRRDSFHYPTFQKYFEAHPNYFTATAAVATPPVYNEVTEEVSSAYAMATADWKNLTLLGGARWEHTGVTALGRVTDPRNAALTRLTRTGDYDEVNPSAQAKYRIWKGLLARAAFSTGITRPNFTNMYPNTAVTYNDSTGLGTVTQNNPSLGPQFSRNYDLSLEYYFEPVGLFSMGYFYKDIAHFIGSEVQRIGTGTDNGFNGQYPGFDLVTTRNYGDATIKGIEINYSQQLRMLPPPFNTLAVFGNLTKLATSGYYGNNAANDELVEFIPRTSNAGVSWSLRQFTIKAQYNYQASFLTTYNADPEQRVYQTNNETLDGGVSYNVNSHFNLYLDVMNVFNREPGFWRGRDRGRVEMHEVFGPRLAFGVNARF